MGKYFLKEGSLLANRLLKREQIDQFSFFFSFMQTKEKQQKPYLGSSSLEILPC